MKESISKKIALLNQVTLDSLADDDSVRIVSRFTEAGRKILEADFCFSWWKKSEASDYQLIYKSKHTPYDPKLPRKHGGNFEADKARKPFYVERVFSKNYGKEFDVSPYMKSYVIIPITYKKNMYGNIVICFKERHIFSEEDKQLALSLGQSTAQVITIHRLRKEERRFLIVSAKQEADLKEKRLRVEFIANATHEIRTPLAIIKGTLDLARQSKTANLSETMRAFRAIDQEVEHISELVSDLAMLVNTEGNYQLKIASEDVGLDALLRRVVKRCRAFSNKKAISIKIAKIPKARIAGDERYLEKLFTNIIKNAIVYGKKKGHVTVTGAKHAKSVQIDIHDDGIGIPKKDLPHMFERFYRGMQARVSNREGTGLGLSIVKRIVETHGGTISVKSSEDAGTTFSVTFPLA